jgi:hypothetical protein
MEKTPAEGIWQDFHDSVSGQAVVFEDDGRVAYAYLCDSSQAIIADVWLYNRCQTPVEPEWENRAKLPFANPEEFVKSVGPISPVDGTNDVSVRWEQSRAGSKAFVYIRDVLAGMLADGATPGWSVMAAKDGPLALVLDPAIASP